MNLHLPPTQELSMPRFTHALIRRPGRTMTQGLTTAQEGPPDYELALQQHRHYEQVLRDCGLQLTVLPALEEFPDSCFVEDPAVVTPEFALITRPGAPSRRAETGPMAEALRSTHSLLLEMTGPGYLDGGDVMMVDRHFFIGLSERTDRDGVREFEKRVSPFGYTVSALEISGMLHLKTGAAYLEDNILLLHASLMDLDVFTEFVKVPVAEGEDYAANALRINDHVLLPADCSVTAGRLRDIGLTVLELPMSEYRKLDGGLSCLSLRF